MHVNVMLLVLKKMAANARPSIDVKGWPEILAATQ